MSVEQFPFDQEHDMAAPAAPAPFWRRALAGWRAFVRRTAPFAAGVLATLLGFWLYATLFPPALPLTHAEVEASVASALASATPPPAYSERVYQIIRPALVLIETDGEDAAGHAENRLGSGVVIDDRGDILTSLHVVKDASSLTLTFADGSQSGAAILNQQPENDIAVLRAKTPPAQLFPAVLGNLADMQVGDEAYAVGNPFGLYSSMSAGIISGFNRRFHSTSSGLDMQGLIQFDAAVNPGNSGGPLLNRQGQVIGIVEGLTNPTDANFFIGIGFAVPINTALGVFGGGAPLD